MQKKRLPSKVLSVVLSLLMMLTIIPLVPSITADAAYAKEYYYPAGTRFIKDVVICYYKEQDQARGSVRGAVGADGYLLDVDLTRGTGGDYYVYMGWTYTTNPNEAVRGFRLSHNNGTPASYTQSGVNWYPINSGNHAWVPQLHPDGCVDTNRGCGSDSDDIFIYITKDPAFGPPLTTAIISDGEGTRYSYQNRAGWKSAVTFQDNSNILDLNKGVSDSNYLYLHYYSPCTTISTTDMRNAYNSTAGYDGIEGYTPASIGTLSAARQEAKTIIDNLDSSVNQGCYPVTQTTIDNITTKINNAANNLQTYLYLDGTTNGGDKDQTVTVTVGKNKTASVDLSKYTATKAGSDFAGWAKSALATTGTTDIVTVGFNETYYALFGIELTANFHYLLTDGTLATETKKVYAMNAATAGSVPLPSIKDATVDGKTFTALGWRNDKTAAANTINKTGVYTIYANNPDIDVYAVYSAPITFTQDTNKGTPEVEPQTQTQYINANTEITKTAHEFTVSDAAPVREGGTFLGWADTTTATASQYNAGYKFTVTEDKTIYAAYKMNYVDVTFVDGNGDVIDTQTVAFGDDAIAPEGTPEKDYDETNHYVFTGWDTDFTAAKTDLTVTAQFEPAVHNFDIETVTAAGCLTDGLEIWTCECGYSKEVITEALDHDKSFDPGSPATCTTDGSTDYITCLRCLEVLQERTVLPAFGHDYVLYEAQTATCSKGGYEIWVCNNNENHKETRNETMPTGQHIEQTVKGYDATCLENGLTEGTECAQCGSVLVPQNIILADGHNLIVDKYVAPTCEETGLTQGSHCEDCDYKVEQEVIPALGHDWADFTAEAATCTKPGFTAGSKCRYCHEVKDSVEIPALNHNWQVNSVVATCTTDGYTEYICSYNDAHNYIVAGEKAFGHKGGTATCNEQAVCETCKQPYGKTTDHNYEEITFPATCTKGGYTEYTCKACGDTYQSEESALAPHTYDSGKITVEAGCGTEGEKTFSCLYCDDFYTEVIPAKEHNVDNWIVEGTEASGDCSDCGEHITANPEDVGLELPECERCGMVHRYNSGLFKYKGVYCSIVYFFRQVINFFKGNA